MYQFIRRVLDKHRIQKRQENALRDYGWEATCPGCRQLLHTEDRVINFRDTRHHWHYMCQCGMVMHYILTIIPVMIGYGRYRLGTAYPGTDGGNLNGIWYPIRLLENEPLYSFPATGLSYVFSEKEQTMVPLLPNQLPQVNPQTRCITLTVGMEVVHGDKDWVFDGIRFVQQSPYVKKWRDS